MPLIGDAIGTVTPSGGSGTFSISTQVAIDSASNEITPWTVEPFVIEATTGTIRKNIAVGAWWLNYEANLSYKLVLTVTGGDTAVITIDIIDVNEAPSISAGSFSVFVCACSDGDDDVGTVTSTDPDTTSSWDVTSHSWSIATSGVPFAIDSSSGAITVTECLSIDDSPYTFDVEVTDGGGLSQTAAVTVTATDTQTKTGFTRYIKGNCADATATTVGEIILGGGGDESASGMLPALQRFVANSGGGDIVVIHVNSGANYSQTAKAYATDFFDDPDGVYNVQPDSVEVLAFDYGNLNDARTEAMKNEIFDIITKAEAVFIPGEDQFKHLQVWKGTKVQDALNSLISGFSKTIMGTSAGAMILGDSVFTAYQDTIDSAPAMANPHHPKIFPFAQAFDTTFLNVAGTPLSGFIIDTHFFERDRMGRLVAFLGHNVINGGATKAVGIDEGTAVVVKANGNAEVLGAGYAFFLASPGPPEVLQAATPLKYLNIPTVRIGPGGLFLFANAGSAGPLISMDYLLSVDNNFISTTNGDAYGNPT